MRKPIAAFLAAALLAFAAPPALAAEVRPQGYLERGVLEWTDQGVIFVPDAERGQRGGRWFRLEGSEMSVFYGLGGTPGTDWIWPNHTVNSSVWEIINASPGGLNYLSRYQDAANYTTGFARAGMLVMLGGLGAIGYGLIYNFTNNTDPPREMQPVFFIASAAALGAGLLLWGGAQASAGTNEALLDQAIDAYNREMAGRRRRGPTTNPYMPPVQDFRVPGTNTSPLPPLP
jgi:hypothetical protein